MSATKKRILCVDANENITSMLLDLIGELGHDARAAAGLAAALHAARAERVDLFIIENRLPDGSGAELATALRAVAPQAPIIFYSNDPRRVARAEAERAGAQAFVSKLDDIAELADAVRRLLH